MSQEVNEQKIVNDFFNAYMAVLTQKIGRTLDAVEAAAVSYVIARTWSGQPASEAEKVLGEQIGLVPTDGPLDIQWKMHTVINRETEKNIETGLATTSGQPAELLKITAEILSRNHARTQAVYEQAKRGNKPVPIFLGAVPDLLKLHRPAV
ncbi:hypothetical protein HY214_03140 [Candidatus Roizmanbacteria bacterium]|nr:hypothetical protein [Candidatus Roizmanbacteria bacterium]